MAGNAIYDMNAPGMENPQLEQMRAEEQRQQVLNSQGTMIAPAPMAMTPEERLLSYEKQMGRYNPGGDVDMASNYAEANLAAQAYPEPAPVEQTPEQLLNPDTDFLDAQNTEAAVKQQEKIDMFGPLYSKMAAQDDLNSAAQILEKNRQESLAEKQDLQQAQVNDYQQFKQKYDTEMAVRLAEIDSQLKKVDEDARAARQTTSDLFQNKSNGRQIAAGIAMVLGAAGGVMKGDGRNVGLEVINAALDNERKQLISNFANSKDMLELKRKNIDDYNEAMIRQMQVADKQKMLQMQMLATKLEVAESQYRGSAAGAAAKDAKANILMQINGMKAQQANAETMNKFFSGSGSVDDMPLQAAAQFLGQKPGEVLKDRRERAVALPGGKNAYATDGSSANKAREIVGASETIQQSLAKIAKIVRENPAAVKAGGFTKAGTEAQMAFGEITAAMKGLEALGALDNGVIKLVDGIVKNPTSLINNADYEKIARNLKQGAVNKLEAFGVRGYGIPNSNFSFKPASKGMVEAKFGSYLNKQK